MVVGWWGGGPLGGGWWGGGCGINDPSIGPHL